MPVHLVPALLLATALLAGCASSPTEASAARTAPAAGATAPADPPGEGLGAVASAGAPAPAAAAETELVIRVGTMPDGTEVEVVVRSVEAGGRREVTMTSPDGVVDRHVVDGDDHWWWIPPMARELTGGVEWVHLDVGEVEAVGELPDPVAAARVPLPAPGAVEVGAVVAGYEVVSVEDRGPDEQLLVLEGLEEPAVLRRRSLPAGTRIDLPAGATELRDLPEAAGR